MRSRDKCAGSGRRAGLRRTNAGTGCCQLRRGLGVRPILFQVGKLQFKRAATLRGLPELFVLQLLDRELELLDQRSQALGARPAPRENIQQPSFDPDR